jgi:hypothetical protein
MKVWKAFLEQFFHSHSEKCSDFEYSEKISRTNYRMPWVNLIFLKIGMNLIKLRKSS